MNNQIAIEGIPIIENKSAARCSNLSPNILVFFVTLANSPSTQSNITAKVNTNIPEIKKSKNIKNEAEKMRKIEINEIKLGEIFNNILKPKKGIESILWTITQGI